jgi:hypothetical protein
MLEDMSLDYNLISESVNAGPNVTEVLGNDYE